MNVSTKADLESCNRTVRLRIEREARRSIQLDKIAKALNIKNCSDATLSRLEHRIKDEIRDRQRLPFGKPEVNTVILTAKQFKQYKQRQEAEVDYHCP